MTAVQVEKTTPRRQQPPAKADVADRQEGILVQATEAALAEAREAETSAVPLLLERIEEDAKVRKAFAGHIKRAVKDYLADYVSAKRRDILDPEHQHQPSPGISGESLDGGSAQAVAAGGFLYYPLPNRGRPALKDATAKQLDEASTVYGNYASEYARRSTWMAALAAERRAKRPITEDLAARLWNELGEKT